MPNLRNLEIPPLNDEDLFEELCLEIWKRILNDPNTARNGRRGQRQWGVDIFGRRDLTLNWVGVQSKVRNRKPLSEGDIQEDVNKAKAFNPRLSELVFATTSPRDAVLQEYARKLTAANLSEGLFSVTIRFWEDIREEIAQETNLDLCHRFYEGAMINYENLGIAVSRVIRLTVGVGGSGDSSYEILLGKAPKPDKKLSEPQKYSEENYWQGHYFIANWNDKTLDTFPIPTFSTDLEHVFRSKRDAFIVAQWLTKNGKILDDLIYSDTPAYICDISDKEFKQFVADETNAEVID
jgi:hypothetical protein